MMDTRWVTHRMNSKRNTLLVTSNLFYVEFAQFIDVRKNVRACIETKACNKMYSFQGRFGLEY